MIQVIPYTTEEAWLTERKKDVTSTAVSALFGCNPWMSKYEFWHIMAGKYQVNFEETERTRWGQRLQDSIAYGIAQDNHWMIRPMKEYIRDTELRAGSSFDFEISPDGLLEVKNVDSLRFWDGWLMEGTETEAPPHIEMQVQHQLMVSGRKFVYIGALIGGNRVVLIRREPQPHIIDRLKEEILAFWKSIEAGTPPEPDLKQDSEFISKLYRYAEPGKVIDVRGDAEIAQLATEHTRLGKMEKAIKEDRDALKASLLMKIGDAEKASGDGFSITAGTVGPASISYEREGYRTFRINWPKKKGAKAE